MRNENPPPEVGGNVHYLSHGSPVLPDGTQVYRAQCRAAIITETGPDPDVVGLCVLNPTGLFFRSLAEGGNTRDRSVTTGGSWHDWWVCLDMTNDVDDDEEWKI